MKVNTFLYFSPQVCMGVCMKRERPRLCLQTDIASHRFTQHFSIGLLPSCYSALSVFSNRRSKILFSGCSQVLTEDACVLKVLFHKADFLRSRPSLVPIDRMRLDPVQCRELTVCLRGWFSQLGNGCHGDQVRVSHGAIKHDSMGANTVFCAAQTRRCQPP